MNYREYLCQKVILVKKLLIAVPSLISKGWKHSKDLLCIFLAFSPNKLLTLSGMLPPSWRTSWIFFDRCTYLEDCSSDSRNLWNWRRCKTSAKLTFHDFPWYDLHHLSLTSQIQDQIYHFRLIYFRPQFFPSILHSKPIKIFQNENLESLRRCCQTEQDSATAAPSIFDKLLRRHNWLWSSPFWLKKFWRFTIVVLMVLQSVAGCGIIGVKATGIVAWFPSE